MYNSISINIYFLNKYIIIISDLFLKKQPFILTLETCTNHASILNVQCYLKKIKHNTILSKFIIFA